RSASRIRHRRMPPAGSWCNTGVSPISASSLLLVATVTDILHELDKPDRPIERRSGSQHAHAYDDKDCREDRPQHLVRHPRTQMTAEVDAGQRANDERTQQ